MNLLITGGCGFIGSNFIRLSLNDPANNGLHIFNLDALTYAGNPENLKDLPAGRHELIEGNICDSALVLYLLRRHQVDAIVHFAAESHVDRSIDAPAAFVQTNVAGTLSLLEAALAYWNEVKAGPKSNFRFLHVSTDEVYGSLEPTGPPFTESSRYCPSSPYAASKAASDHLARSFHHTYGLPVLVSNCSNNYGPYQFPEKLMPLMILNALERKPLPIYGRGDNIRDWLYVEDHCRALTLILKQGRPGETYLIGGECERNNIEIVDALCGVLNQLAPGEDAFDYKQLKTFVTDRQGHDKRYAMNISKIRRELGWQPLEQLQTGLRLTVEWYLKHRDWCENIAQNRYQRQRLGLGQQT
ncbi:MAG: dTDP-glucose 4,6-dehydratase [Methylacidiphilales bacterium]|nr:dTDP-glucose 4,6-dehydratase [Candidatus Methylacidiphilales bacterium]